MRQFIRTGALLLALSWLAVGCSSGPTERDYSLPGNFCGTNVPEDLYAPLFPPGSELKTLMAFDRVNEFAATRDCVLAVDDERVLRAEATGEDKFEHAIMQNDLDVEMEDAETVPGENEAIVWPGVAMVRAPCSIPAPGDRYWIRTLTIVLEADHPGDDSESRQALSELIQPFMAATLDIVRCEESQ